MMTDATQEIVVEPFVAKRRAPSPLRVRAWGGLLSGASATMLGIGLYLKADPRGLGTHQQLGMPPCGFYHVTGIPCPMCGCTTAVTLVAHGHWFQAVITQPFGAGVGFMALLLVVLGGTALVTGRWYGPDPFTLQWHARRIFLGTVLFVLAAWIYKISVTLYSAAS